MNTDDLIGRLAQHAAPVVPLRPPWRRAMVWVPGAVIYLGAITAALTSQADVVANGTGWRFVFPQIAAVAVSVAAAVAAFSAVVPGASRRVLWWPAAAIAIWFASLVPGSLQELTRSGPAALVSSREWLCVATIVAGGALPAWWMTVMLRQGAPLTPRLTAGLTVLAAAGLANVTACLSHPHPSQVLTLGWHGLTMLILVVVAAWTGRRVFAWTPVTPPPSQST